MSENTKELNVNVIESKVEKEDLFNGSISPSLAWEFLQQDYSNVKLVDVRTNEERVFTGYIAESIPVPWATGTSLNRNPRFIRELENKTGKEAILILVCRSGNRSRLAAIAAKEAGFKYVFNIREGFEGELNQEKQRNKINGWKFHSIPWQQE